MLPIDSPGFLSKRWAIFSLLCSAFVLAFFHRVAPTVLATQLAASLSASAVALGSIAAMYFHVYAAMQIPAGLLIDRLGARRGVSASAAIAGIGSIIFALAPDVVVASIGRFVIGFGVSFAFVGALRAAGAWFRPEQYAQVSGWIILIGNMGAILAGTPLAFALEYASWRTIFVAVGILSIMLALAILIVVRDTPAAAGFAVDIPADGDDDELEIPHGSVKDGLQQCLAMPTIWLSFFAGFALVGPYFGFAGIWAVPFLVEHVGLTERESADCLTLSLILLTFSPAFIGWYSDRIGQRRSLIIASCATSAIVWVLMALWPDPGFWVICGLLTVGGASCSGMVLIYATAKDLAPHSVSGFAVALVNTGLFTGAALLQIALGWMLERGGYSPDGDVAPDFVVPILALAAVSALGFVATLWIRETHPRTVAP